jgi:SAM-dependent methyltransferase
MKQTVLKRMFLLTVGRLSDGIRIACDSGLTSGKMVDYVYGNRPSGRLLVGRWLDRMYLSDPAWQAVRQRARLLTEIIGDTVRGQLEESSRALILDIASGQARYIQDVLVVQPAGQVEAVCWDLNEQWLEEGRQEAQVRGLKNILYQQVDVMTERSYLTLPRRPDIVVASGFYDWFDDPGQIRRSLGLVRGALSTGGRFVFTIQTGHVDLHKANSLFRSFDDKPLRMKAWSAQLVHGLARGEGFQIERTASTAGKCYCVTVARKCL